MKTPATINEAISILIDGIATDRQIEIMDIPEKDFTTGEHFGLGLWMRNQWRLWENDSDLASWFSEQGIEHADDMSEIILTVLYRTLTGQSIDLDEISNRYKEGSS